MKKIVKQDHRECKYYRPNNICDLQSDKQRYVGCAAYSRYGWHCPDFTSKTDKK